MKAQALMLPKHVRQCVVLPGYDNHLAKDATDANAFCFVVSSFSPGSCSLPSSCVQFAIICVVTDGKILVY